MPTETSRWALSCSSWAVSCSSLPSLPRSSEASDTTAAFQREAPSWHPSDVLVHLAWYMLKHIHFYGSLNLWFNSNSMVPTICLSLYSFSFNKQHCHPNSKILINRDYQTSQLNETTKHKHNNFNKNWPLLSFAWTLFEQFFFVITVNFYGQF